MHNVCVPDVHFFHKTSCPLGCRCNAAGAAVIAGRTTGDCAAATWNRFHSRNVTPSIQWPPGFAC